MLAENTTINEQPRTAKNGKLVMQVNKYIPHFQRIPTKLGQRDLKMFQEDYNLGNIENDVERERLRKIQHYIIGFDRILIDSLIVDRQVKFQNLAL